jgi:chemotaxis protein MotB
VEIKLKEFQNRTVSDEQHWLLSYSDMVTLLLAFFVLFFAISQVDQSKFEMIMEYFSKTESTPLHVLEEKFKKMVKTHNLEEEVDVALTPDGLLVNFQDNILFDSGKATLKEKAFVILSALGDILKQEEVRGRKVQVEGHTDTVPVSKNVQYPSNWELSTARASGVIRYLIAEQVEPQRFVAVGFADTRQRVEETEQRRGLSVNRRVSLLVK